MKLTTTRLKQIIKEEIEAALDEGGLPGDLFRFDVDDETGEGSMRMSDKYQRMADREDAEKAEKRAKEKRMADADARREPEEWEKEKAKDDSLWKRIFKRGG